jgi:hypothetical protein
MSGDYREALTLASQVRARMFEPGIAPGLADFEMAGALVVGNRLFLGHWGAALDELAIEMASARRNGNPHRTMWVHCTLAWVHLHALDFQAVIAISKAGASFLRDGGDGASGESTGVPALLHSALICMGSAAAALGDIETARKNLHNASRDMANQIVFLDWYWQMQLDLGLATLHLLERDLDAAQADARRLLSRALAHGDRTWRGLAWELNARVAVALGDHASAMSHISMGADTIRDFDGPIAAWRVHATAAAIHEQAGDAQASAIHLEMSRHIIDRLATSLEGHSDLREKFLSSPQVAQVLQR